MIFFLNQSSYVTSWSNVSSDSKFQVAMMAEQIVNKHIILGFVYEKHTRKITPKSVTMKLSKIGLHSLLNWSKVGQEPKFYNGKKV